MVFAKTENKISFALISYGKYLALS